MVKIFSIEGNIGSGKSTLIRLLEKINKLEYIFNQKTLKILAIQESVKQSKIENMSSKEIENVIKIDGSQLSEPVIGKNNLYILTNNSVVVFD